MQEVDECLANIQEELDADQIVNTDTSEAYAKLKLVYPNIDIISTTPDNRKAALVAIDLSSYFGTTKRIAERALGRFRRVVAKFTDASNFGDSEEQPISLFPLIRVVRVFMKSKILNAGLVLVDLPGIGDANAARNAVAQRYIHHADHIFIISKIVRAVTDGAARELLGNHFQKRLVLTGKYNGGFVSFIATCTDDMAVEETVRALGRDHEASADFKTMVAYRDTALKEYEQVQKHLKACGKKRRHVLKRMNEATNGSSPVDLCKKRKYIDLEDSEAVTLTVDSKRTETDTILAQYRLELDTIMAEERRLTEREAELTNPLLEIKRGLRTACIQERNNYTCRRLQLDFESGLRSIRKELNEAKEKTPEMSAVANAHQQMTAQLKVFCVSSKAFQKLNGRLQWDQRIEGFPTKEYTGIPDLQRFAYHLSQSQTDGVHGKILEEFDLLKEAAQRFVKGNNTAADIFRAIDPQATADACLNKASKVCTMSHFCVTRLLNHIANS